MKKRHVLLICLPILVILIFSLIWIFSKFKNDKFWDANFYEIISVFLTALIGVLGFAITVYMVTDVEEKRRYVDALVLILDKIDEIISTDDLIPRAIEQGSPEYKKMISSKRNVTNYIDILRKNSEVLKIKNDIQFIFDKFHEYEICIDNCCIYKIITEEICVELGNILGLIQGKICEVRVSIYSNK